MAVPKYQMPLWAPANEAAAVTPSDIADIAGIPPEGAKLYIGVTGDVTVDMKLTGTNITFKNAVQGSFLPVLVTRVYATGTSATNLVAVW